MIDVDASITLIQRNFPRVAVQTALPITRGWDSFVLEVNGKLIFRFPMRDDVIPYLQKEMGLLSRQWAFLCFLARGAFVFYN